jgi:hypothetical protein
MHDHTKLALELFGGAFIFMILATIGAVSLYVLIANLMGW